MILNLSNTISLKNIFILFHFYIFCKALFIYSIPEFQFILNILSISFLPCSLYKTFFSKKYQNLNFIVCSEKIIKCKIANKIWNVFGNYMVWNANILHAGVGAEKWENIQPNISRCVLRFRIKLILFRQFILFIQICFI